MAICKFCIGGVEDKSIPDLYCGVCGFGFIRIDDKMTDVTSLHGRAALSEEYQYVAPKPVKAVKATPKPVVAEVVPVVATVVREGDVVPVTVFSEPHVVSGVNIIPPKPKTAAVVTEVDPTLLAIIKANGPVGKAKVLELTSIPEADWLPKIKALLAAGLVIQEGEKRGAKYRTV